MRAYEEAVAALERALVFGINPSLDGIRQLTEALGRPQDSFVSIQVTGTNGKTSTARLTEALLRAEGVRTGLYTSPHLTRYPERIEVGGLAVTDEEFGLAVQVVLQAAENVRPDALGGPSGFTEFELLTAAALWHFARVGVEIAVLEVGMGGRWDATSVVDPKVAVITGVGLDHTRVLGESAEQIAAEKAGIVKAGSAVVLGPSTVGYEAIFIETARRVGSSVRVVCEGEAASSLPAGATTRFDVRQRPNRPGGHTVVDVSGTLGVYESLAIVAPSYQAGNVAVASVAAELALGRALDVQATREALRDVKLPARFELVRAEPPVVVDGSHNPQAAHVLAGAIAEAWPDPFHRPDVLIGVLADKDADGIVAALAEVAGGMFVCAPRSERALSAQELGSVVDRVTGCPVPVFSSVNEALEALLTTSPEGLVVTGSLVTAAEARGVLG